MVCSNFARLLAVAALSWILCGNAGAAPVITLEDSTNPNASPSFDLTPPAPSPFSGPGATTLAPSSTGDTSVFWSNTPGTLFLLRDSNGNPLSQGAAGTNQDGMLVQLGYFNGGTIANNFAGDFIPLTFGTRIGDSLDLTGAGAGAINFQTFFALGSNVVGVFDGNDPGHYETISAFSITASLPAADQVLAIRFFDTATGATGFYNTVSADNWLWQTPTQLGATVTIDLANSPLEWQDAGNQFKTTIAVPEPSAAAILALGGVLALGSWRRRK